MKKIVVLLLIIYSFSGLSQKLSTIKLDSKEKISFRLPNDFILMGDQDRMKQVYSSKIPVAVFSNETQEVIFSINYNEMQWTEKDTELVYDFYNASVNNLFDKMEFIQNEIKEINGRTYIVFEVVGSIVENNHFLSKGVKKRYAYIQYTSWNNQVLLFSFSCNERLKEKWEEEAQKIMGSIKIKR